MHKQKVEERYNTKIEYAIVFLSVCAAGLSYFIHDLLRIVFVLAMLLFLLRSIRDQKRNERTRMYQHLLIALVFFSGLLLANTN